MIHIFSNLRLRKRKTFRVHHIHWFPARKTTWWSLSPSWSRRRPLTSSSSSPFSPSWFRKRPTWWWSTTFSLFFSREKTSNVSKFVWEIVLILDLWTTFVWNVSWCRCRCRWKGNNWFEGTDVDHWTTEMDTIAPG